MDSAGHVHLWNPAVAVRPTDVTGFFEVRIMVTCQTCGIPLKFVAGAKVLAEQFGLVAAVVAEAAGG